MHLDSLVWCRAMSKKHAEATFTLKYPVSFVKWHETLQAAISAKCMEVRAAPMLLRSTVAQSNATSICIAP